MIVLGLTGSIAMGKSTAAGMLKAMGLPLHDADAVVHRLLGPKGKAVGEIAQIFPDVVVEGQVDRNKLGQQVFRNPPTLKRLEAILHPLVRAEMLSFLKRQQRRRSPLVVLDIPLLFETGGERYCDFVILVSAPGWLQRLRALRRPGMTEEKFEQVLRSQMPDHEKRKKAHYIVSSGLGRYYTWKELVAVLKSVRRRALA